ncbi:hypothetical protein GCM10027176_61400 [Actinoallomurus bryophytorum]|uniref:Uncharacterized protein n=1 Tax=Actinoallomurus bryophytorum TaxID=1490222 RepID=A0A543CPC1_9ACTN|nr:hypothetical protein [Actinoallomurus bryophytorum]TQL98934.1 hypothetical protein FB559_4585 [Actinoallomurus bryophytorum]
MIHHLVAASALTGNALFSAHTTNATKYPKAARRPAAMARDGSHHHDGNGHHNRNIISVRSPTHNRGYQHTNNSNAGGTNPVQNALCRHVTVCTITQKVNIIQPTPPASAPATPVQALLEPVVPQRMAEPEIQTIPRPAERHVRGPFMYMGADGFVLMAPGSTAPATFGSSAGGGFHIPLGFFG